MEYNLTSEDYIIKYTINLPKELYLKIAYKTRKGTRYNGRMATYIREILEKECIQERPISMKEYLKRLNEGKVYEPPKRFSGFIDSLLNNNFKWSWFKKHLDRSRIL